MRKGEERGGSKWRKGMEEVVEPIGNREAILQHCLLFPESSKSISSLSSSGKPLDVPFSISPSIKVQLASHFGRQNNYWNIVPAVRGGSLRWYSPFTRH